MRRSARTERRCWIIVERLVRNNRNTAAFGQLSTELSAVATGLYIGGGRREELVAQAQPGRHSGLERSSAQVGEHLFDCLHGLQQWGSRTRSESTVGCGRGYMRVQACMTRFTLWFQLARAVSPLPSFRLSGSGVRRKAVSSSLNSSKFNSLRSPSKEH